jgi:pyridoxine 4-dehydrogenase
MPTDGELFLPTMGCGTWAWGNRLLWGYNPNMDEQLQGVFNLCVGNGVTLFDTGDSYGTGKLNGRSELLLGKFARECRSPNLDNLCIATKLAAYPWRLTRKSMVAALEASSRRLGRNVDLVQMHWSTANYAPWQEWALLDGLGDAYDRGLVKGVGLSNYGPRRLRKVYRRLADRSIPITTLQVQYSLLTAAEIDKLRIRETCQEFGIQIIAYSPLTLGLLTGKYSVKGNLPGGLRRRLFKQLLPKIRPLLDTLEAIARSRHRSMSQVAINWCMAKGTIPIPGAKNMKQAQENLGALGWQLDSGEVEELEKAATRSQGKMVQNVFQTK